MPMKYKRKNIFIINNIFGFGFGFGFGECKFSRHYLANIITQLPQFQSQTALIIRKNLYLIILKGDHYRWYL